MKKIYTYILMAVALMLVACTSEDETSGADGSCTPKLTMDTSTDGTTRAYWHDDTPAGGSPAVFHWEADTNEVHTALYSAKGTKFIKWTNDSTYSRCAVKPWSNDQRATITSFNGVNKDDYSNIAKGDKVYFLNLGTITSQTTSNVAASLGLPSTFSQKEASTLEEFKDYTYAYTSSDVLAVSQNYISVNPARFTSAVACLRIIIENTSKYSYKIQEIKMATDDATKKVFANKMEWKVTSTGVAVSAPSSTSGYYSEITNKINYTDDDDDTNDGNTVEAGDVQAYYMLVFPVSDWKSVTNLLFDIKYSLGSNPITTPQSVLPVSKLGTIQAGKIYNLHFKEMVLDVDNVTIDDWVENAVNVGQITVKTPEVTVAKGGTVNVLLNAGHLDVDKISVTCPAGSKLTAAKRVVGDNMYIDITADTDATAGTYTVEVNDQESNSGAVIQVTVN